MITLRASNNLALADCLGGYVSQQDFPCWRVVTDVDQIRCLFIDHFRLPGGYDATKAEFTITKDGDDFTLAIAYPTAAGSWTDLAAIEFTLALNKTYQSAYELGDIRIRRVLTGATDGYMSGRVSIPYNTPLGGADADISGGTITRYGCLFVEFEDETYIETITAYGIVDGSPDNAACQIGVGSVSGPFVASIADVSVEPAIFGSWGNDISVASSVNAGFVALWYKTVSTAAVGETTFVIEIDQAAGGASEKIAIIGRNRRYDATLDPYVVYGAYDGSIIEGTEIETFAAIPGTVALELPPSGTRSYLLRVVARNKYGVESQNQLLGTPVKVNAVGAEVTVPQTPSGVALTFLRGGHAKLTFTYAFDTATPVVYAQVEIGTETSLGFQLNGFATYLARTITPVLWGESVPARVCFINSKGQISAWVTVTADAVFDPASLPSEGVGRVGGMAGDVCQGAYFGAYYSGDAALMTEPGLVSFYYAGVLEFYAEWNEESELVLYLGGWRRKNESVSGAQTDLLEDAGAGIVYISDGTTRRIKLDTTFKTFSAVSFKQPITLCRREAAAVTVDSVRYLQAYPATADAQQAPEPWVAFDGDAVLMCKFKQTEGD